MFKSSYKRCEISMKILLISSRNKYFKEIFIFLIFFLKENLFGIKKLYFSYPFYPILFYSFLTCQQMSCRVNVSLEQMNYGEKVIVRKIFCPACIEKVGCRVNVYVGRVSVLWDNRQKAFCFNRINFRKFWGRFSN